MALRSRAGVGRVRLVAPARPHPRLAHPAVRVVLRRRRRGGTVLRRWAAWGGWLWAAWGGWLFGEMAEVETTEATARSSAGQRSQGRIRCGMYVALSGDVVHPQSIKSLLLSLKAYDTKSRARGQETFSRRRPLSLAVCSSDWTLVPWTARRVCVCTLKALSPPVPLEAVPYATKGSATAKSDTINTQSAHAHTSQVRGQQRQTALVYARSRSCTGERRQ